MDDDVIARRELEARFEVVRVQFSAMERETAAALAAADKANTKAETSMEKRFDNTNEWRATVEGLQRSYLPRQEFDAVKRANDEKFSALKELVASNTQRSKGMSEMLALILSIVAVLTSIGIVIVEAFKK